MKVIAIIPARYASSRFPGKVVAPIAGLPMIQRVYERASRAQGLDRVIVATDDERVIYRTALALLRQAWQRGRPVRLLGVTGQRLCPPVGQLRLF